MLLDGSLSARCPVCNVPLANHRQFDRVMKPAVEETPNAHTRHLLARLDQEIIELDARIGAVKTQAVSLQREAGALGTRLCYIKAIRAELRPMLDPSAPSEFPYDKRQR